MKLDDTLHNVTTLLTNEFLGGYSQGTGFFYQKIRSNEQDIDMQNLAEDIWIVTNRHVLIQKNTNSLPDGSTFYMRIKGIDGQPDWNPIKLNKGELELRAKFHPNSKIDVAIIHITDLIKDKLREKGFLEIFAISNLMLPENSGMNIEVSDDVSIIGYPQGYYDSSNVFPIVKPGSISSKWGIFLVARLISLLMQSYSQDLLEVWLFPNLQISELKMGNWQFLRKSNLSF